MANRLEDFVRLVDAERELKPGILIERISVKLITLHTIVRFLVTFALICLKLLLRIILDSFCRRPQLQACTVPVSELGTTVLQRRRQFYQSLH